MTLFSVSWKRPNGQYGRRRFSADSVDTAVQRAGIVAGLEPDIPRMEGVRILDAFNMALAETKRGTESHREWLYDQRRFIVWLAKHYPDCTKWCLLTRKMVKEYLASFTEQSPNRIRIAMQPIIQTAGYMEREYSAPNVTGKLKIKTQLVRETPKVFLADVMAFLDWLRQQDYKLETGAALQGLAGLQLQEALRLTWNKVDLDRELIEISGEVKNIYRNRVIPVPQRCLESLRHAQAMQKGDDKIIDLNGPVVVSPMGCSYADGKRSWCNYSEALREKIQEWNKHVLWTSKDLRNCIMTHHKLKGSDSDMLEMYVGHAARSVTMIHYVPRLASGSIGEGEVLKEAVEAFRKLVVNPIDEAIEQLYRDQILNNFEHEGCTVAEVGASE